MPAPLTATPQDGPDSAQATWDALAPAYDILTAFHDHDAWAAQLDGLVHSAGLTGKRILDVGCGTGASTAAIRARGYDVTGVDVSPGMLERAARRLGPDVALHCHDIRALPQLGRFDAAWLISDVINFLLTDDDLAAAFAGVRRNLAEGGLVLFDADTRFSLQKLYSSLLVVPQDHRVIIFDGRMTGETTTSGVAEAYVDVLERADAPWWRRVRTVSRQRHHDRGTLERALAGAGFELVDVWGTDGAGSSERPLDEDRHNKAVYIARSRARIEEGRR